MAPIAVPVGLAVVLIAMVVARRRAKTGTPSALEQARRVTPPTVSLQRGGEYEHGEWWGEQDALLKEAWKEWWSKSERSLPALSHSTIVDPLLREAVQAVRSNPTKDTEAQLRNRFHPILPHHVYQIPLFTPDGVERMARHLDAATAAGIPTRRPNGMNRHGVILDPHIEGAVSHPGINDYLHDLVDDYVRPLARTLFPELASRHHPDDDRESYAFTIRYRSDLDLALAEHVDASIYTINVNLNAATTDDPQYQGSSLYFVDPITDTPHHVSFSPGMAVLHRGQVRHAALPITQGERHNLVIWLFGRDSYVRVAEYDPLERLTVQERWG